MSSTGLGRGARMLPGMNPRPQKLLIGKKNTDEEIASESKSTFVFVQDCENVNIKVTGKVGKIVCERGMNVTFCLDNRIVGGTLELIKTHGAVIRLDEEAEVPIVTADSSSDICIKLKKKSQLQSIYFHDSKNLEVNVERIAKASDESSQEPDVLEFKADTANKETHDETGEPIQWVSHWSSGVETAEFITEKVVRDGIYPSTAQMKRAAEERELQAMNRLVDMFIRPRQQRGHQRGQQQSQQQGRASQHDAKNELQKGATKTSPEDGSKEKENGEKPVATEEPTMSATTHQTSEGEKNNEGGEFIATKVARIDNNKEENSKNELDEAD